MEMSREQGRTKSTATIYKARGRVYVAGGILTTHLYRHRLLKSGQYMLSALPIAPTGQNEGCID